MGLDPGSLAMLAQGITAGGNLTNAAMQGVASHRMGRYEQMVANQNAANAELQAKSVIASGDRAAQEKLKQTRQLIAMQRVAAAGQGVEVDAGTGALINQDTAALGALDAEAIRNNAWRDAWGLRAEASQMRHAGRAARGRARMEVAQTAATGGIQFANDLMKGSALYERFKKPDEKGSTYDHPYPGKK